MNGEGSVERRIVTVLFADLVGFTPLSERLDPEDVSTIQSAYFSAVRETIARYGGQIEKFIGDAAMAVFGIPRTRDDDAERAVRAGLALVGAVEQLGARLGVEASGLEIRVGLNTGEVVHAEDRPGEWRVTGDAVNVAARLQAAASPGTVLMGETTGLAVAEAVEVEAVGSLELKGKTEPVRAWIARRVRPSPSREHAMGNLRAPMVGREGELSALSASAARVAAGTAERWLVVAPPGVGKSRLLEEFAKRIAPGHHMEVWRARLRPDVLAPYEPVAQLFASALAAYGWAPTGPNGAGELSRILAQSLASAGASQARAEVVMDEAIALLAPDGQEPDGPGTLGAGEREQRFQAWLEALDALAAARPVGWMVEDVHWSGRDLLAFLALAGSRGSRSARLVLATARPSLLEREPDWCDPSDGIHLMHLPPLSPMAAESLVEALIGRDALPLNLMSAVAERSDGNPLFIEELLRTWISIGTLVGGEAGTWSLATPAEDIPLPPTVQAIYAAQLDDLSPEARRAARRASVIGRRFPRDALPCLGIPEPDPAIEILSRRALVAGPFPDPLLGRSHQFRHALLRDAGYASLSRAERALLHVRLAGWLEEATGTRSAEVAEVIGNHYRAALLEAPSLAHDVGDGLDRDGAASLSALWFERAAAAALDVAAHDAARTLFRAALDLTPDVDVVGKARRWQRLGDATAYVADMDEGARAYEAAADLFRQVLEHPGSTREDHAAARAGLAASVTALGLVRIQQVRFKEAVALAETALDAIGRAQDLETGWLLLLHAWGTEAFAHAPGVKEELERAVTLARAFGDGRLELEAGMHLANVWAEEGTMSRAEMAESDLAAARTAADLRDWQQVCKRLRGRAIILMEEARDHSLAAIAEAAAVAEAHALTEEAAWVEYVRTEMGLLSGDWDSAVAAGIRALDLADRNAYHRVQIRTWAALSPVAAGTGRHDLLKRAAVWFDRHQGIFPHSPFGNVMHGAVDLRLAAAGLIPPVEVEPEDVLPAWEESQGLPSWHAAVEAIVGAWMATGRTDAVRRVLDRIAAWDEHPLTSTLGRGSASMMLASLHAAEHDARAAEEPARRAVEWFRACGAPWWLARALRLLGTLGRASAEETLEAVRIERDLGVPGFSDEAGATSSR
jgi:class 3 adenylate cyclase/tetratricopeptide (TPR) repeat protein